MVVCLGAALVFGVIAACVASCYYCKRLYQQYDKDESIDSEPPLVRIKISHPQQEQKSSNEIGSDASDSRGNSIDSNEAEEVKQVVEDAGPVSMEEPRTVSVKLPPDRRRVSSKIWSTALQNQLKDITNSSSEICGSTRVVQAQIEVKPTNLRGRKDSLGDDCDNSSRCASTENHLTNEKGRKLSFVAKKLKNLKKTIISSRPACSVRRFRNQRLSIPLETHNQPSPIVECSSLLPNNRFVDVSTSTRISANASNLRAQHDEAMASYSNRLSENGETSKQTGNDHQSIVNSKSETLQEVVSLIKRQSIKGKSICDVTINGLAINHAELLDLFEASEGETRSASIVSTKEASIISIKFHRRRNDELSDTKDTSYYECPLTKFYRSLPELFEDISFPRLFRSQEVLETSKPTPSIRVSDHSMGLMNSTNETSYISIPRVRGNFVAKESVFQRGRNLSRRVGNSHVARFVQEHLT
ncbi:hypothetical protein WN48_11028 [Eufriesea mexicana]|uniref:uncharacterized protein LOC108547114 n=1 Tax=Eufriesea mexicana TaxID=516756 RepID=UPI00083C2C55|nr:PREDICTED: uncharacterized protein LOC108547114 [Eufriesea mexicana]OAD58523.1 hypothetical protein WN48_11028 [Eufriesea mexicana]